MTRCALLALASTYLSTAAVPPAPDDEGFERIVRPFIGKYCVECHGPDEQKGKLRLDTLGNDFSDPRTAELWGEVVNTVNSHEMPPEDKPQPQPDAAGEFADWLAAELGRAEIAGRASRVILRRMNRAEYNNTIRDLTGVDFQPAEGFPEDASAGGFDNIGQALSLSPLQIELYYDAARTVLDRALVEATEAPPTIRWRFEPEEDASGGDRTRVERDGNRIIVNKGINEIEGGHIVMRQPAWNRNLNIRNFQLPDEGEYIIRFRASARIPNREAVVTSAQNLLLARKSERDAEKPENSRYHQEEYERQLEHFTTSPIYDYGPPRVRLTRTLGGTPETVDEMDVDAPSSEPAVYEIRTRFTTADAGITFDPAYEIPRHLENHTLLDKTTFARPELLIDWVEIEGPIHPTWPPASHSLIMGGPMEGSESTRARDILERFMTRAYRRPVAASEIDARLALFTRLREEKPSFIEAIKPPLAAVLASPHFLFLVEPAAADEMPRPLDPYELASRLSYFLWSSMPDELLFEAAQTGRLLKREVLLAEVDRMLSDPKSRAFVQNFAGQWLGIRKVGSNPPAPNLYPEYDRHLETSIVRETEAFFAEILDHDLDTLHFLRSDFVTINERLARFYGIPGVKGDHMRRVAVPDGVQRGGLVTQASIHTITSNGTRTSPVLRGVWVLKTLLGTDPGLPVANAGEIANQVPGIDKATVRQRLEIHREAPACARCHNKIDPLGLSLENFNAAGQWREQEGHGYQGRIQKNDPVIDASAKMPDGTTFVGVRGLQEQLLQQEDKFLTALSTQLHTYALGREMGFADRPAIATSVNSMKSEGRTLRALVRHIVSSPAFTTK
jgi:hypothetical protein